MKKGQRKKNYNHVYGKIVETLSFHGVTSENKTVHISTTTVHHSAVLPF